MKCRVSFYTFSFGYVNWESLSFFPPYSLYRFRQIEKSRNVHNKYIFSEQKRVWKNKTLVILKVVFNNS